MRIVIVTGTSGSGKSSVLNYLEDNNFYCVDNLPLLLIDKFLEIIEKTAYNNVAIGVDIGEYLLNEDFEKFRLIKKRIDNLFILYLDTTTKDLYKRYNESRRKHPLNYSDLENAIEQEKNILLPIKNDSDYILDTTGLKLNSLYKELDNIFNIKKENHNFFVNITSFGFKYGNFKNSHLMFDVRFLPNPYFIDSLRDKNGLDDEVYTFVLEQKETKKFLERLNYLIDYLLPLYKNEGRHYLNIAIGCTGGKHRSVSIARYLYNRLNELKYDVMINHREIRGEDDL